MRTIKFRGKIVGTDNEEFDGKWVSTLIGFSLLAAIIAWLVSRI